MSGAAGASSALQFFSDAITTASYFYDSANTYENAEKNYRITKDYLQGQRDADMDQASQFDKQGNRFMGTQRVGVNTSGITGVSSESTLFASKYNLLKDASRMREQASLNYKANLQKARLARSQGLQEASLLSMQGVSSGFQAASDAMSMGSSGGFM